MSDDASGSAVAERGLKGQDQAIVSFEEDAPSPVRRLQGFLHDFPTAIPFIVLVIVGTGWLVHVVFVGGIALVAQAPASGCASPGTETSTTLESGTVPESGIGVPQAHAAKVPFALHVWKPAQLLGPTHATDAPGVHSGGPLMADPPHAATSAKAKPTSHRSRTGRSSIRNPSEARLALASRRSALVRPFVPPASRHKHRALYTRRARSLPNLVSNSVHPCPSLSTCKQTT